MTRSTRLAAATALAVVLHAVMAVIQLTHDPSGADTVEGFVEHVQLVALSLLCLAMVPFTLDLAARSAARRAGTVASAGLVALSALCLTSTVSSGDLAIFPFIAIPANLAWLGGYVAVSVKARRSDVLGVGSAVALVVTWFAALPASAVGGGFVAAAILAVLARRLGVWGRRTGVRPLPATA